MSQRRIFTPDVYAKIPVLLAHGLSGHDIAERIGCTYATLKVRCSGAKISLRQPKAPISRTKLAFSPRLSAAGMAYYRRQSAVTGTSTIKLVTELLEVIAKDDLLNAVLDYTTPMKKAA